MECPYCNQELSYIDYYGKYLGRDEWDKVGDIFKCGNEDCEVFEEFFYTDIGDELFEGYPC